MSPLVGRAAVVEEIEARLGVGRAVALHGPTGIGKSALLDDFEARADATGTRVLRARGAAAETSLRYAALQDLLDQVPADVLAALPEPLRPVRSGLVGRPPDAETAHLVDRAWLAVLTRLTTRGEVLLVIDDAQWLDPGSVAALAYAARRLPGRVRLLASWGPDEAPASDTSLRPLLEPVELAPLGPAEMSELLADHGIAASLSQRIWTESGGLPALALALAGAAGEHPTLLGRPSPTPPSIEAMLRDRVAAQAPEVRATLGRAALAHRPSVRRLVRAGTQEAETHLRHAARAGLVTLRDDEVRFTPPLLARLLVEEMPGPVRADAHRVLAGVASWVGEQLLHEALAAPAPDADLAADLAERAGEALGRGDRELACELYLLAADHCPPALGANRVEWLACAVEAGAPGNHADLIYRALDDFLVSDASPAQRVRVRVALVELAGAGLAMIDEVLTAATTEAGQDPGLLADVLLQRSRVYLRESQPHEAERHVREAVRLLRQTGDVRAEALALPILAGIRRWTGAGDHDAVLARALALPEPATPGMVHLTPRYMAARFALYDDRLEEAWQEFLAMLTGVERGAGQDTVHLLRCLVEAGARLGRCREALAYASRAEGVAADFDLAPHTSWFITATAELVGGDPARARRLAEQGVLACEETGDRRYLQRHLLVLGQVLLRQGEARAAVATLGRIRDIEHRNGISDPSVNRWQAELVPALVATGELAPAAAVLAEARAALADRSGVAGTVAQLDRAEAELSLARGEYDRAAVLLDSSDHACRRLSMSIDLGRALLVRAQLERRRRRVAASRVALEEATAVFGERHAEPWVAQAHASARLPRPRVPGTPGGVVASVGTGTPGGPAAAAVLDRLTPTEAKIVWQVAEGASNREVAERLFVSVKTVEATLTRIYRKLGIRSRTQLAALVLPGVNG